MNPGASSEARATFSIWNSTCFCLAMACRFSKTPKCGSRNSWTHFRVNEKTGENTSTLAQAIPCRVAAAHTITRVAYYCSPHSRSCPRKPCGLRARLFFALSTELVERAQYSVFGTKAITDFATFVAAISEHLGADQFPALCGDERRELLRA